MKTFRPDYMSQTPIAVFQSPRIDSQVIFTIPLGVEVELVHDRTIVAHDPMTDRPYGKASEGRTIELLKIRYDGKLGYVNRRWLKPSRTAAV